MGLKPSPNYSTRFYYWAEEFTRGNQADKDNILRWDEGRLNLIGDKAFNPTLPRVMKWDCDINNIAGDMLTFVDDLRASDLDEEVTWRISRQIPGKLRPGYTSSWDIRRTLKATTPNKKDMCMGRSNFLHHYYADCLARKMKQRKGTNPRIERPS